MALITDYPTITAHTGKCYKALIDLGRAISPIRYSTYQTIDISFKTPIQATTTKLNTADGSPMTALEITALQLRIADFKFTQNFITCDKLPDMEILFGIDIQKNISLSYAWDKEKNCYIQKDGRFHTYTTNCEQKATIGIVKSTLKIPPRQDTMALFQSRSKAIQSKDIGHISSVIGIQEKWKIPI